VRLTTGCAIAFLLASWAAAAGAGESAVGFLVTATPVEKLGREAQAACALARQAHGATVIAVGKGGAFVDERGEAAELGQFAVVWYHQGDDVRQAGQSFHPKTLEALRKYVSNGGGLYLSGAALAMVQALRVEPVATRLGGPGNDGGQAGLSPAVPRHPIFQGLTFDGGQARLSNRGYPAFSDFHGSGGPSKGMLLANAAPNGGERPMAEYELGKGRIIVMGWRLPHYAHASNPHRANLEKLTANILAYLATPKTWQKVVVKPPPKPRRTVAGKAYAEPPLTKENAETVRLAIQDLTDSFAERYPKGHEFLQRLARLEKAHESLAATADMTPEETNRQIAKLTEAFRALRREALLANPLLGFGRLLLVRRSERNLGLPANWQSNSSLPRSGFDNEIAILDDLKGEGKLTTVYRPANGSFVGDVDLHWDADRLLFSAVGSHKRWRIFELKLDGSEPRELPLINEPDVDNYDACYLPGGRILFTSTAPFVGVPCVTGSSHVSNIYLYDPATPSIRRLTFEQDHDWCPTVLNNGRVLYLRWEYSDIPHYVSRILFHMNPDGTEQMEYYGSNSYWPNSTFFARPCPGHPTRFVGVVSGHHDVPRMGELILFDPTLGRHEADGVVQRIPGRGQKVEPTIRDGLVRRSWPKFLHPWPLSDKYILASCKPTPQSRWGLYLADVFDNLLLLKEEPWFALLEPIPLRELPRPPIVTDKAKPGRKDATVYMADVYVGRGLDGVPRGTVKRLRLFTYQFAYRLSRHGRAGEPRGARRPVGCQAHRRHRARRARRLGLLPRARQHAPLAPAPRRRRQGPPAHAKLDDRDARRGALLRRMPRAPEHRCAEHRHDGPAEGARRHRALLRAGTRLQLRPRGPASPRRPLHPLPQRQAPRRREDPPRLHRPPAGPRGVQGRRLQERLEVPAVLHCPAQLRPRALHRERHPSADPARVPRRHDEARPEAREGALRGRT